MVKTLGVEHYIITVPDERLRIRWPEADRAISQSTLRRMMELSTRGAMDGRVLAGLSSVQVELPGRVVTVNDSRLGWVGFVDPVVVKRSYHHDTQMEGCFSLPKVSVMVTRPTSIVIRSIDKDDQTIHTVLAGVGARFACHEIDHINGILITDYQIKKAGQADV